MLILSGGHFVVLILSGGHFVLILSGGHFLVLILSGAHFVVFILSGGHFVGDRDETEDARYDGPAEQRTPIDVAVQECRCRRPGLQPLSLHRLHE